MNRLAFLKTSLLAGLGLNFINPQKIKTPKSVAYLTGKKNPYKNYKLSLHFKAYKAFEEMHSCALMEGIDIKIVSGYRSFNRQLNIWNTKFSRYEKYMSYEVDIINKVASFSAIPGTSRHHWGTEIDIIDQNSKIQPVGLLNSVNYQKGGAFYKMHLWLKENAYQFGYQMVYTDTQSRTGFKYEPWHFSYAPVAKNLLDNYSKHDLPKIVRDSRIKGNTKLDENCLKSYFQTHLLGINPTLLP